MIVREIDRSVETAYINLQEDIEKWKKRKSMANFSYILSVYVFYQCIKLLGDINISQLIYIFFYSIKSYSYRVTINISLLSTNRKCSIWSHNGKILLNIIIVIIIMFFLIILLNK